MSKSIEEIVEEFRDLGNSEGTDVRLFIDYKAIDWLTQTLTTERQKLEEVVDAIWNDDEMQSAIEIYGEWNNDKLNEYYNVVKEKHLAILTQPNNQK